MKTRELCILVIVCSILQLAGIAIFAKGFFPYKTVLPGFATENEPDDFRELGLVDHLEPPKKVFDRLVFIVIDALRSDFMFSNDSSMTWVQSQITSRHAFPFTAHALPPTVTLPRIKALTTGSIPNFLDAILNIAESDTSSTLVFQDTWLAQANLTGKRLVMYGDDTWIKLFPGIFTRSKGTSSFFVSDFTEVDHNVTRHLDDELERKDWDILILHYLGLDHIGHLGGPRSIYMQPKQREMDSIIERIYNSFTTAKGERTLMVICGDHGMNDAGNHGGSSSGETSTAVLFASPSFPANGSTTESPVDPQSDFHYYTKIQQSDLVPTISTLLGWPIPRNNIGILLKSILHLWKGAKSQLAVIGTNVVQMSKLVKLTRSDIFASGYVPNCSGEDEIGCAWSRCRDSWNSMKATENSVGECFEYLFAAQALLSSASTDYRISYMYIGLAILLSSVIALTVHILHSSSSSFLKKEFGIVTISFGAIMFASSYVEEEHQFWYWITSTHFTVAFLRSIRLSSASLDHQSHTLLFQLPLLRIIRRWNQTGQKFAGAPDIVKDIMQPNPDLLAILVVITYLLAGYTLYRHTFTENDVFRRAVWPITIVGTAFIFKISMAGEAGEPLPFWLQHIQYSWSWAATLVIKARISFGAIAFGMVWYSIRWVLDSKGHGPWISEAFGFVNLFLMGQTRYANIPLFLLFEGQRWLLERSNFDDRWLAMTCLWMQHVSFFALGNSNSLSSVDLSNAYNGISSYSIPLVGLLTFISNWAGPIWWAFAAIRFMSEARRGQVQSKSVGMDRYVDWMGWCAWFHGVVMCFLVGACIILRTHLFIWTVFSPKFLFQAVWMGFEHVVVEGIVGGIIWCIG